MLADRTDGFDLVVEAPGLDEALPALRATDPDVVLLDLLLPGVSGTDAFDEVAAAVPDAMILALSALSAVDAAAPTFESGAFAYLEKSLLGPPLVTEIQELRDLHRRAKQGIAVWEEPDAPSRIRR